MSAELDAAWERDKDRVPYSTVSGSLIRVPDAYAAYRLGYAVAEHHYYLAPGCVERIAALEAQLEVVRSDIAALGVALGHPDVARSESGHELMQRWIGEVTHLVGREEYIARLESRAEDLVELLAWCSGAAEFQPGGESREEWERDVQPWLPPTEDDPNG